MGMYLAFLAYGWFKADPYVSLIPVACLVIPLGLALYRFLIVKMLNIPEDMQLAGTIGLTTTLSNAYLAIFGADLKGIPLLWPSNAVSLGNIRLPWGLVAAFILSAILLTGLYAILRYTIIGKALRAAVSDRDGAYLVGIPVGKVYALAFVTSAVLAAAAGVSILAFMRVHPDLGLNFTIRSFAIVVLGGMGNIIGAMVAAFLLGITEAIASLFLPLTSVIAVSFVLVVLVLLFRPQGIFRGRV